MALIISDAKQTLTAPRPKGRGFPIHRTQPDRTYMQKFDYRVLVTQAKALGHERKDVFDQNYGTVRAYHRDAWLAAYGIEL